MSVIASETEPLTLFLSSLRLPLERRPLGTSTTTIRVARMSGAAAVWMTAFLGGLVACRGSVPPPGELALGTFIADLNGIAYTPRDTARIA